VVLNVRRLRSQRGAAAVEMALILPIFLILVLGIIQYGLYFSARQGGSDIARDAARRAAVGDPAACTDFRAAVRASIAGLVGRTDDVQVTRTYTQDDPAQIQVGDTVHVSVAFNSYDLNVPMVPVVEGGRIETTVLARVEFVPSQPETCS
jgi:Flp pilus assembly protein TadG